MTCRASHKARNPRKNKVAKNSRDRSKVGPKVGFLVEGKRKTYFQTYFRPISGISPKPTFELLFGYFIFSGISGLVARAASLRPPESLEKKSRKRLLFESLQKVWKRTRKTFSRLSLPESGGGSQGQRPREIFFQTSFSGFRAERVRETPVNGGRIPKKVGQRFMGSLCTGSSRISMTNLSCANFVL